MFQGRNIWNKRQSESFSAGMIGVCLLSSLICCKKQLGPTLIGIGDSLTHGTMDATNNEVNTRNAYLQKVAEALEKVTPIVFSQPFFDEQEQRKNPFQIPTNLGVDGGDLFTLEGIEYGKRVGAKKSFVSKDYLCDRMLPQTLSDDYDKVLYPINLLSGKDVSQLDSAVWFLDQGAPVASQKAIIVLWDGNNDTSQSVLGEGGKNPFVFPIPTELILDRLFPPLKELLKLAGNKISFAPYTKTLIDRGLTEIVDFRKQFNHLLERIQATRLHALGKADVFILTLPYYSSVGYLFDSDDLEFYLQQINPSYSVPATFKRVGPRGQMVTDPFKGDRVSILTFIAMFGLIESGVSITEVNRVLEEQGKQNDGLVLSEEEQMMIRQRIDDFNEILKELSKKSEHFHFVDIAKYLNDVLTGKEKIIVKNREIHRKWGRGSAFSLDGVHPAYTAQAIVANFILGEMNQKLGLHAPLYDLSPIFDQDPYIDHDGDGWPPGPSYTPFDIGRLFHLLKDPSDQDPLVIPVISNNIWKVLGEILLDRLRGIPIETKGRKSLEEKLR